MPTYYINQDASDEPVTLPDGTVLDGDVAEEYAHRALEAARNKNLIPGRKSLSGESKHSPLVTFRVPEELRAQLDARAAVEGVRVSQIAREALRRYLESARGA